MKVNTKPYGTIEVDDRQKIYFPYGILGFETFREFVLLDALQQPFYWLQSMEVPEIAFVLINPQIFQPEYRLEVADTDLEEIDTNKEDSENILTFAIVTIPENHSKMTANLQGPIIINRQNRKGRQSISLNPKWKIRHYILDELSRVREEVC
ncbi:MAG: flagellar assembly protein FliW [Spirochaetales bacterium]|jgi:flagellar assembly factor FliW|nr:flagellar assembly protein FliW [Spirochaetales bacterium]